MKRLNWIGTGCIAAMALAGAAQAQTPAQRIAAKMGQNSLDTQPQVMTGGGGVTDEPSTQMVPAVEMGTPSRGMSGLATSKSGRGKISVDLGKESDDVAGGAPRNIFEQPMILKMLGENPRFVYRAENMRDPMLIPWVRRMAIFKELIAKADQLIPLEKYEEVAAIYKRLKELEDDRFASELATRMAELDKLIMEDAIRKGKSVTETNIQPDKVELPAWVADNTKAALIGSKDAALCLIGDFVVKEGDPVPGYKYVKVKSITSKVVTFEIANQSFTVDLEAAAQDADKNGETPGKSAPRKPRAKRK